jgi:hypothetical protein
MHTKAPRVKAAKAAKPAKPAKAKKAPRKQARSAAATSAVSDDESASDMDMDYVALEADMAEVRAELADELGPAPARPSTFLPYFMYTHGLSRHVDNLRVKTKRKIYVAMRQKPEVSATTFLPQHGLSVCEFTVWQTLNDKPRRSTA